MKIKEELPATNTTSVAGAGDDGIVVVKKKKKNFIGKTYINRYHSMEKLGSGNFGTAGQESGA